MLSPLPTVRRGGISKTGATRSDPGMPPVPPKLEYSPGMYEIVRKVIALRKVAV